MPQQALEPGAELHRGSMGGAGRGAGRTCTSPHGTFSPEDPEPPQPQPDSGPAWPTTQERVQDRRCRAPPPHQLGPVGRAMTEVAKEPEPAPMGTGLECKAILPLYPLVSPEELGLISGGRPRLWVKQSSGDFMTSRELTERPPAGLAK